MPTSARSSGTAVIIGASGAVGKPLLTTLLSSTSPYSTVYSFARRPHPSPPTSASNIAFKEVIVNFDKLHNGDESEVAKLSSISSEVNAVFITMGTTRAAAGSMAEFEKIDRGYVLSCAKALLDPSQSDATLVYCSSGGSSSSSWFPYLKSKGRTEEGLAALYKNTIIFHPGFLQNAHRSQTRLLEKMFEPAMNLASKFTDSVAAPVESVAKAMVQAAKLGVQSLLAKSLAQQPPSSFNTQGASTNDTTVIVENQAVLKLAQEHDASRG
ncbi:uncharacterized protein MEPE_01092 [Melanopsichium pennsylvanicum]|uniref:NAD(P)-binding domain-containing protein n=2 Tax=Melanopsichium pennsylvanicum TaxID=63383 RepID=A0AAJ4XI34_9BASI|nr:conserved hypothetical protein [Melanopsichium pennsylvanicum 4]SNX82386.1 uncharacterized protein MEPE_01092 [Melanopsichium pennsylvanicum]